MQRVESKRVDDFANMTDEELKAYLVTCAWIWREIFKLIRLPFPFF